MCEGEKYNRNFMDHTDEEYARSRMFLSDDEKTGFALTLEGDLINWFNHGGVKKAGKAALVKAIELGAKTLDCYNGHLPKFYTQFGFVETGRIKFKQDYAPAGWDCAKLGRPEVVFMAWRGKNRQTVAKDLGSYTYHPTTRYYGDWDQVKKIRGFKVEHMPSEISLPPELVPYRKHIQLLTDKLIEHGMDPADAVNELQIEQLEMLEQEDCLYTDAEFDERKQKGLLVGNLKGCLYDL
jgi:hypothetical protein